MPRVSSSPKPWKQYTAVTTFLRVPRGDWTAVKIGAKTEFRASGRGVTLLNRVTPPVAVVAWTIDASRQHHSALMVLEETWAEEVGAIAGRPESLEREGFESMAHFRRYWMARKGFRPFDFMERVQVYRVRPWRDDDLDDLGRRLIQRLYAEHLPNLELESVA